MRTFTAAMRYMVTLTAVAALGATVLAGHDMPGESPAKPATNTNVANVVQKTMTDFINKDVGLKGSFLIQDPESKEVWSLTLDKLHPIQTLDDTHYFACADLKGRKVGQGAGSPQSTIDVDFFVNQTGKNWEVSMIELHKENGVVRDRPYSCPMHKKIMTASPGKKCPVCGMEMKK